MGIKMIVSNMLISFVFLLSLTPFISSFSNLGQQCQFSRDCSEGFCINSTCKIPEVLENYNITGSCNATIDCNAGFCLHNECIVPIQNTYQTLSFGQGLSSSCAGFIENCTGFWCMFCNVTWILTLITAGAAAYITRKSGRFTPMILFIIPILAAIIFFPFFGTIIGLLELFLIAFLKPILQKVKQQIKEIQTKEDKGQKDQKNQKDLIDQNKDQKETVQKDKKEDSGSEGMEQLPFD